MRAWAVVPVKCFTRGKSRLAPALSPADRADLARSFASHVLDAVAASRAIDGVIVLTDCPEVDAFARARGAEVMRDAPPGAGLGTLVDGAIDVLAERGARASIVLMSDLPLLAPFEIDRLVDALDAASIAIAPDRRSEGTNALAMSLGDRLPTCFGNRDSFALHHDRARAFGRTLHVERSSGLACDVDSPDDLAFVQARGRWNRNFSSRVSAA